MERVFSNELSKFLLLLGIGVLSLSTLMYQKVARVRESFTPYQKPTIWYLVLSLLFFAFAATIQWFLPKVFKELTYFLLFQAYFILLGTVHVQLMHHHLKWTGQEKSFWMELLFTLLVGLFGCFVFVLVFRYFNKDGFELAMSTTIILFILPLLINETFNRAISIPQRIVKHWFYPINKHIEEPDESKLKNLLIISFEFQKRTGDTLFTNFRAKAPADMDFGQLFYFFINDYDERHPNTRIEMTDLNGEPYGWIFYKKPRWYSMTTKYIDFSNTIYLNKIRENDVIICSRSQN